MCSSQTARWITTQIGAREHYAVPRALQLNNQLDTLFTDFWSGSVIRGAARCLPFGALRSLASRYHPDLVKVAPLNLRTLAWRAKASLSRQTQGPFFNFIELGQRFASAVREKLRCRSDLSPQKIFFAYDTGALETLEFLKERAVPCVLDQMDSNRVAVSVVREEERRWPGWARPIEVPEEYFQRREKEWALADRIVVNSEFSLQSLVQQGVPRGKLTVIPLCYEAKPGPRSAESKDRLRASEFNSASPLKVLFLGQVALLKGVPYLVEAAKLLQNDPVQFDVVGPIGISEAAVRSSPANMVFHGRVNRDEAASWYRNADLFVLPTLADGFALTQLEAMAHGLPVIATPNCGAVVQDGGDGFVVAPRDAAALAKALQRYLVEPELLRAHRTAAWQKSRQFTLARLGDNLTGLHAELTA